VSLLVPLRCRNPPSPRGGALGNPSLMRTGSNTPVPRGTRRASLVWPDVAAREHRDSHVGSATPLSFTIAKLESTFRSSPTRHQSVTARTSSQALVRVESDSRSSAKAASSGRSSPGRMQAPTRQQGRPTPRVAHAWRGADGPVVPSASGRHASAQVPGEPSSLVATLCAERDVPRAGPVSPA
jgi:hypothetical protein